MKPWASLVSSALLAALSGLLVLGSASLALLESGYRPAYPTFTPAITSTIRFSEPVLTLIVSPALSPIAPSPTPTALVVVILTPTPSLCPPPPQWVRIIVHTEDTLRSIAHRYHTTVAALREANCLPVSSVVPGTYLYVPPLPPLESKPSPTRVCRPPTGWVTYRVRPGDTLYALSQKLGISVAALQAANCLNTSRIYAGQALLVPFYPPSATATVRPTTTRTSWPTATRPMPTRTPRPIPTEKPKPPTPTDIPLPTATPTDVPLPPTSEPTEGDAG